MTRYAEDHKQATRQRILDAAGRRLKSDGIDGSGVATLMKDAGLTNGAFYAHFGSKEELVAATVRAELEAQGVVLVAGMREHGLAAVVRRYLSLRHRDDVEHGCPSAALLDEIVRGGPAVRAAYREGMTPAIAEIAAQLSPDDPASALPRAWSLMGQLVGALQLTRALDDRELATQVLEETATRLVAGLPQF